MRLPKICQVDFTQFECFDPRMNVKLLVTFKTCSVRVTLSEGDRDPPKNSLDVKEMIYLGLEFLGVLRNLHFVQHKHVDIQI